MRGLRVRATGALALVEDLGRPGLAGVGVGRSGAADRGSLRLANRLLGNPEGAAAVEVLAGGLEVEVGDEPLWCCVSGAVGPVEVDGRTMGSHAVLRVPAASRVRVRAPYDGLRSYLAVRGGLEPPTVLGSHSHDVLAALGPAPLAIDDLLAVGRASRPLPDVGAVAPPVWGARGSTLRVVRGPRDDLVVDVDLLAGSRWRVGTRSDRVGARLDGPRLRHVEEAQLPSEGVWRGAVQVPPDGDPVLFLADHPVTGGYPVVAVVVDLDVDRAAQLRPGEEVSFRFVRTP